MSFLPAGRAAGTARGVGSAVVAVGLLVSATACSNSIEPEGDPSPTRVRISEIHYHDPESRLSEFVELLNAGDSTVSIGRWCIKGAGYCFGGGAALEPGDRITVATDKMKGGLRNSGETLRLVDGSGKVRDKVAYGDDGAWPKAADGLGYSLQLIDAAADGSDPTAWIAARPSPGTGPDEPAVPEAVPRVVFNELNYHPADDDPAKEFIELANTTSSTIDVGGWEIVGSGVRVTLADGASVPGNGLLVVNRFTAEHPLSNGGGPLRLLDAAGAVVDALAYEDSDPWPALADGFGDSLQRIAISRPSLDTGNWVAGEPSAGSANAALREAPMPVFSDVHWTIAPTAGQSIEVTAYLRGANTAALRYRIGFDDERTAEVVATGDGRMRAVIPAQPAGSLVRFRLFAGPDGAIGSWPRQGDGSTYAGTVVADQSPATKLPVLQWFMPPRVYNKVNTDRSLSGDSGYPFVLAYRGVIYDNALIRMKGQQSRYNPKHKWKVTLPAGHRWADDTFFSAPANEFALNAMSTDKSYVREILTSDLVGMTGGYRLKANAVRVQRNGEFQGLYVLTEQPDKSWRALHGLSNRTIVWKAERQATMQTHHLSLPKDEFAARFHRQTQRYDQSQTRIRDLIKLLNTGNDSKMLDYAYRSIDIPQVINVIASMRVAQHFEWDHKNYEVMFDPEDGRWRLLAIDYDLNMGSRWHRPCGSFCFESLVYSYDHFKFNKFGALFINTPELRSMLDRRTKTIADQWFAGTAVEERIAELAAAYGPDDDLDVQTWHRGWGKKANDIARQELIDGFVVRKRKQMVEDPKNVYPPSQAATVAYDVRYLRDGRISVKNVDKVSIDLSGMKIPGLPSDVPAGVVLNRGQTLYFTFERAPLDEVPLVDGQRALVVWVPGHLER